MLTRKLHFARRLDTTEAVRYFKLKITDTNAGR